MPHNRPTAVVSPDGFESIAAGDDFTLWLSTVTFCIARGSTMDGQLGTGTLTNSRGRRRGAAPGPCSRSMPATSTHAAATSSTAWVLGLRWRWSAVDANGQSRADPDARVLDNAEVVSAGAEHTCVLDKSGGIRCSGSIAAVSSATVDDHLRRAPEGQRNHQRGRDRCRSAPHVRLRDGRSGAVLGRERRWRGRRRRVQQRRTTPHVVNGIASRSSSSPAASTPARCSKTNRCTAGARTRLVSSATAAGVVGDRGGSASEGAPMSSGRRSIVVRDLCGWSAVLGQHVRPYPAARSTT